MSILAVIALGAVGVSAYFLGASMGDSDDDETLTTESICINEEVEYLAGESYEENGELYICQTSGEFDVVAITTEVQPSDSTQPNMGSDNETSNTKDTTLPVSESFEIIVLNDVTLRVSLDVPSEPTVTQSDAEPFGNRLVSGSNYELLLVAPYETFERSLVGQDYSELGNLGGFNNVYRIESNGSYEYYSNVSETEDCFVLGDTLQAPCSIPGLQDDTAVLQVMCTANADVCDAIVSSIEIN